MEGYKVEIVDASKELSARDRVKVKDTSNALSLDEETRKGEVIITVDYYATLHVENPMSQDKEYDKYVVVDDQGIKYVTGSKSFLSSFLDIAAEMEDTGEQWQIVVYRKPSKKYQGKDFITCSLY